MMLYKRDGAVAETAFNYEVQEHFPMTLARAQNLHVQLDNAVSPFSNLNVDVIGWR